MNTVSECPQAQCDVSDDPRYEAYYAIRSCLEGLYGMASIEGSSGSAAWMRATKYIRDAMTDLEVLKP